MVHAFWMDHAALADVRVFFSGRTRLIEGFVCWDCGDEIDGDTPGHSRYCQACIDSGRAVYINGHGEKVNERGEKI